VDVLAKAAQLLPENHRVRYNYALALRHLGKNDAALSEMLNAYKLDQSDPGIVQALAIFYMQEKKWEQALAYAEKLVALAPGVPGPEQMVKQILQEMSK
jgi:Flp pilus assembly protein TadD